MTTDFYDYLLKHNNKTGVAAGEDREDLTFLKLNAECTYYVHNLFRLSIHSYSPKYSQ